MTTDLRGPYFHWLHYYDEDTGNDVGWRYMPDSSWRLARYPDAWAWAAGRGGPGFHRRDESAPEAGTILRTPLAMTLLKPRQLR